MRKMFTLILLISAGILGLQAQPREQIQKATLTGKAAYLIKVPSIASQLEDGTFIPAPEINKEVNIKRTGANKAVPGKGLPKGPDPLWEEQTRVSRVPGREPILTFEAVSANATPTDPTGAVGPNHFVNAWNSSFRIWDKTGNPLTPSASLATIFPGESAGDPIVLYDQFADRFLITQFTFQDGFLVAISQGPDPVNSGWYTYFFPTSSFPDYPKYSIWSDGYYITANKDQNTANTSEVVFALERDEIILGNPDAQFVGFPLTDIVTSGFYSPLGFNVTGSELPPPGNAPIVYVQDDSWSGVSEDHLKIWSINVDWNNTSNSTISNPQIVTTQPFDGLFDGGSFSNLPQPSGPDIDALQATIMYMAQYRRFAGYNTVVFNFVVDLDGNDDYSGIRWYELRQDEDGNPWTIYQEGTYSQPDGHSAFSGNMCMDSDGNIALAYTIVSNTEYPSLRYTGRFAGDPLGTMTVEEDTIMNGTQSDPSFRYGDYSQMTIDPTDDKTFWSIGEIFTGGSRKNYVGAFKLAPELALDAGVISIDAPTDGLLSANEPVTITVRNFGLDTISNIPVSYRIDQGAVVNDVVTDTLPSGSQVQFTFTAPGNFSTAGQTYQIMAATGLPNDGNGLNDTTYSEVTHLYEADMGVTSVLEPVSGSGLTGLENITVSLHNFGGMAQSDFDVTYILDGDEPVTEQVTDTLESLETLDYTFMTPGDFSMLGEHFLTVYSSLDDDSDVTNDTVETVIENFLCQPDADCSYGDGIEIFELEAIYNPSGCDPNGYGDYTDLVAVLSQGSTNDLVITTGYGDQFVKVWIDFNDNYIFEPEEIVVDDYEIASGQNGGTFTDTIPLVLSPDALLGEHLMRAKTNYDDQVPNNACESTQWGETEDYTVIIDQFTIVDEMINEPNDLNISWSSDNQFSVRFIPELTDETLIISVHNIAGQKVIQNRVPYANGMYRYDFDMSYAPKGVYIVRLGGSSFVKAERIIVR